MNATIYARLNTATITALVGTRITPLEATTNTDTLPFLAYATTGGGSILGVNGDTGLVQYSLDIITSAHSWGEVRAVLDAVRVRLHGWTDRDNGVGVVMLTQGSDTVEPAEDGGYVGSQTYSIWSA